MKFCLCASLGWFSLTAVAEPISVKHAQGTLCGFLTVHTETGKLLGSGELSQIAHGDEITAHLTYTFLDGSIDDETTTYSQRGVFRLVRDRHVQKGPFFENQLDVTIEAASGTVTTKTWDKAGKSKVETAHEDIPDDAANGMIGTLLLNISGDSAPFKVGYLAPSGSKGRLVKLAISRAGDQSFRIAGRARKAAIFVVHVDLGGIAGVIAPVIGKEPKDTTLWVLEGEAPSFIREVGQMSPGGPVVSIELAGSSFREAQH